VGEHFLSLNLLDKGRRGLVNFPGGVDDAEGLISDGQKQSTRFRVTGKTHGRQNVAVPTGNEI
jgi:hypothetical protein